LFAGATDWLKEPSEGRFARCAIKRIRCLAERPAIQQAAYKAGHRVCGHLGHAALDIESTPDRIHHAAELSEQPISGVLDDPPTVLSDLGIDERAQMVLEPGVRPPSSSMPVNRL
jgi:hypothetical protein